MSVLSKEQALEWLSQFSVSEFEAASQGEYVETDLDVGQQIECVSEEGGEGDGAPISKVFRVSINRSHFYFRINGTYSSWADTEYDDEFEIVEPREVTVTQYFNR